MRRLLECPRDPVPGPGNCATLITGETLKQTIRDHGARACQQLLGWLKDEPHGAVKIAVLRQIGRRRQRRNHMAIMAAAMEFSGNLGGIGHISLFIHRQGIKLRPEGNAAPVVFRARRGTVHGADNTRSPNARGNVIPKFTEAFCDKGCGAHFFKADLGVTMNSLKPFKRRGSLASIPLCKNLWFPPR